MSEEEAISILCSYGLDQVLTEQDDPRLWAAALKKYFPNPEDPNVPTLGFSFGIAASPSQEDGSKEISASGLKILETWRFSRMGGKGLRAIRSRRKSSASDYPIHILDISRPSVNTTQAYVHAGRSPAPLIGGGETRLWTRQENGEWIETDQIVSSWVT
jgi:hypothetical protein